MQLMPCAHDNMHPHLLTNSCTFTVLDFNDFFLGFFSFSTACLWFVHFIDSLLSSFRSHMQPGFRRLHTSHWSFCQAVLTFPCCQAFESYDGSCHPSGSIHHEKGLHLIESCNLWSFLGCEAQLCCHSSSDRMNCECSIWRYCGIFCPSKCMRKKKGMLFGDLLCYSLDHRHTFWFRPSHLHCQVAVGQLCVLWTANVFVGWLLSVWLQKLHLLIHMASVFPHSLWQIHHKTFEPNQGCCLISEGHPLCSCL